MHLFFSYPNNQLTLQGESISRNSKLYSTVLMLHYSMISPAQIQIIHLHITLTCTESITAFLNPLLTAQRYVPVKFLLMFLIIQGFPTNILSPSLPSSNTLVQVIFAVGSPVVLQTKVRLEFSFTRWSTLVLVNWVCSDTGKKRQHMLGVIAGHIIIIPIIL